MSLGAADAWQGRNASWHAAGALEPVLLVREARLARLDRAFGVRLATVTAGAGFGKSTLLEMWAADVRCAWHSLTSRDRAVESLADGVMIAPGRAVPERVVGLPVSASVAGADGAGAERWVGAGM